MWNCDLPNQLRVTELVLFTSKLTQSAKFKIWHEEIFLKKSRSQKIDNFDLKSEQYDSKRNFLGMF